MNKIIDLDTFRRVTRTAMTVLEISRTSADLLEDAAACSAQAEAVLRNAGLAYLTEGRADAHTESDGLHATPDEVVDKFLCFQRAVLDLHESIVRLADAQAESSDWIGVGRSLRVLTHLDEFGVSADSHDSITRALITGVRALFADGKWNKGRLVLSPLLSVVPFRLAYLLSFVDQTAPGGAERWDGRILGALQAATNGAPSTWIGFIYGHHMYRGADDQLRAELIALAAKVEHRLVHLDVADSP